MPSAPSPPSRPPWRAQVLTLFPQMFPGTLGFSLAGKALAAGLFTLDTIQIRDFGIGRHKSVDGRPMGGGAGMVMRADVLAAALDHAAAADQAAPMICLSPRGAPLTQALVREWAAGPGLILLAGRFEGIDQRLIEGRALREVSIGDFVLSGGEPAAIAVIDAVVRLLPGVLGDAASAFDESFEDGLLEYPQYARPREWEGRLVPNVLLSGDHNQVAGWRRAEAELLTRQRRPDLWAKRRKP